MACEEQDEGPRSNWCMFGAGWSISRDEARRRIEAVNEPYKLQILDSIKVRERLKGACHMDQGMPV